MFPTTIPAANRPDSFFTRMGTDAFRLVYVGSLATARGIEVTGMANCYCRPDCPEGIYRLLDGRTLAHARHTSLQWEERPEPDPAERALLLAILGRDA